MEDSTFNFIRIIRIRMLLCAHCVASNNVVMSFVRIHNIVTYKMVAKTSERVDGCYVNPLF